MSISASAATVTRPNSYYEPKILLHLTPKAAAYTPFVTAMVATANRLPSDGDCLPMPRSSILPQPTQEIANRAAKIAYRMFSCHESFQVWLSWGFSVYRLLKQVAPAEAKEWPHLFSSLKNAMPRVPEENCSFLNQPQILEKQANSIQKLEALYQRLAPQKQCAELLDLLTMWKNCLRQDGIYIDPGFNEFSDPKIYSELRELLEFIHLAKKSHPELPRENTTHSITFQWHKLLPKKPEDLRGVHRRCMIAMTSAYGNISVFDKGNQFKWATLLDPEKTLVVVDAKGTFKNTKEANSVRLDTVVPALYASHGIKRMYEDALSSFTTYFSSTSSTNYTEAISATQKAVRKVCAAYGAMFPSLEIFSTVKQQAASFQKQPASLSLLLHRLEENGIGIKTSTALFSLYRQMAKSSANAWPRLNPFFEIKATKPHSQELVYCLLNNQVIELAWLLRYSIDNMGFVLEKLDALRAENVAALSDTFRKIPPEIWETHQDAILDCIEKMHLIAAEPVLNFIEMLFGLSFLTQEHSPVMFVNEETFSMENQTLPLARFIAFSGAQKTLQKLKKQLHQQQKPNPTTAASTSPIDFPLVEGLSAPSTASSATAAHLEKEKMLATVAASTVKKAKTKTRKKGHASAAASAATDKQEKTPEPTAATAETETWAPTPKKTREIIDMLRERGYHFLRQGSDHEIYFNKAKNQTVPVPRHKTQPNGTAAAIDKQTK